MSDILYDNIYNYQTLCLLDYLLDHGGEHSIPLMFSEARTKVLSELMSSCPNFIRYQYKNMRRWFNIKEILKDEKTSYGAHNPDELANYVLGLTERNSYIWQRENLKDYFCCLLNKSRTSLLDYGCGGLFYAKMFNWVNPLLKLYGYERTDVADFVKRNINFPRNFALYDDSTNLAALELKVDVIWISEVFHSDTPEDIQSQIAFLKNAVAKPDTLFLINELKRDSPEGMNFDVHMRLHGTGGRLYSPMEMNDIVGFKNMDIIMETKFHYTIGGII